MGGISGQVMPHQSILILLSYDLTLRQEPALGAYRYNADFQNRLF